MATVATSFKIPVDIPYREQKESTNQDLQTRVLQIIQQKGHFRHVTERSLLSKESLGNEDDATNDEEKVEETPQNVDEKLVKSRDDMLRQLDRAQNDNLVALEAVSFLLSKHSSSGRASMSDELKKRVAGGTLESKVVQSRQPSDTKEKQLTHNSQGWRSKGFNAAFQSLSTAAERLRKESDRESKYWQEVAELRDAGNIVSRYPRDGSAVAVHLSAPNSLPRFRQQGIALLRQDNSSNVYLDRGLASRHQNQLQIQVYRDRRMTGFYNFSVRSSGDDSDAMQAIYIAQNNLLDEESFHEMDKEGRLAANQGITTRGETISFSVGDEYQVALVMGKASSEPKLTSSEDELLAEFIGISLRALLYTAHRESFLRRTSVPPPILAKPRQAPDQTILRPLVANLRHRVATDQLRVFIEKNLLMPVRLAGLDIDWQESPDKPKSEASETLYSAKPPQSGFRLILPSQKHVQVKVSSSLLSPVYGTQYEVSSIVYSSVTVSRSTYQGPAPFHAALLSILRLDLVAWVSATHGSPAETNVPTVAQDSLPAWQVSRPHNGVLLLSSKVSGKNVFAMRIDVHDGVLALRLVPTAASSVKKKSDLIWAWSSHLNSSRPSVTGRPEDIGIDKTQAERLSFSEVITRLLQLAA